MTTEKQIIANRKNAKLSTGPRNTRHVAMSNLKHGLLSMNKDILLEEESVHYVKKLSRQVYDTVMPADPIEVILTEQLIISYLRWRRSIRAEAGLLQKQNFSFNSKKQTLGDKIDQDFGRDEKLLKISRYSKSFERSFFRAIHELERRGRRRSGEYVPLPVAGTLDLDTCSKNGFET